MIASSLTSDSRYTLMATALLGATTVLGFAPFYAFPLPVFTIAAALVLWRRAATPRAAALRGFLFGCGMFLGGVSWVFVSMREFGGMPTALAALATALFCAVLAIFPTASAWLVRRLLSGKIWVNSVTAASAWALTEWLRSWVFTGFPWLALGYSQSPPSPLAGFAPLVGIYGLSFISVALASLLAESFQERTKFLLAGGAIVTLAIVGHGLASVPWTSPRPQRLTVSLLQGNIEQSLKWRPELLAQSMGTYLKLARDHPAHLIVLPETALPTIIDEVRPDYLAQLAASAGDSGGVLLGIVTSDGRGRYLNSVVSAGDTSQRYSKSHLVPFGEFTPAGFGWSLAILHIPMSDFGRGSADQRPLEIAGEKVAVNICYEDAFGEQIIRALPEATLLVNVSNVAWFGDSLAPAQHLQIAQLRALETGRFMLRSTNTGETAVVSPQGIVSARLPTFTAGALRAEVRGYTGLTPFARGGNAPVIVVILLILSAAWLRRPTVPRLDDRRRGKQNQDTNTTEGNS